MQVLNALHVYYALQVNNFILIHLHRLANDPTLTDATGTVQLVSHTNCEKM